MKAIVNTRDFVSELKKVMLAANAKQVTSTPLANAIKIDVLSNGRIKFTSYNFTVAIETVLECEQHEEGSVCVNSKSLFDVVSKCISDVISISTNGEICTVKSEKAVFSIPCMDSDSYSALPKVGDISPITVDVDALINAASKVLYAVALDEKRPALQGVNIEIQNGTIDFVACDGFRLANVKIQANSDQNTNIIVPAETVNILSKILMDNENDAQIFISRTFIIVKMENVSITSRLIAGPYMDWKKAIPNQRSIDCIFEKSKLVRAIDMAQTVQTKNGKITGSIVFKINGNVANVSLKSQAGQFEDEIEFETNGNLNMSIAFNPKYLLDAIRAVDSNEIDLMIIGSLSPCFVKNKGDDSVINMVLPVRIKE